MYTCSAYGLLISSDFCLLQSSRTFSELEGQPDVVVQIGRLEEAAKDALNSNPDCFKGTLPDIGQFWIQPNQITVQPSFGVDEQTLSSCILGTAFSVLLQQRGFLVLHASAVVIRGKAIAFIGFSGAGKSTTASAFMQSGYSVITDDVLAIQSKSGHPEVVPSYPIIKLLPDAIKALGHSADELPLLHASSHKRIQTFDYEQLQNAYPLERIYLLSKGDRHTIQPLIATEALVTLVNQSRAAKNLIDPSAKKLHFQQCAELTKMNRVFRLRRKPGLEDLSEIVKLVETDLGL
jgi:preprotein translocase subunit Sss1